VARRAPRPSAFLRRLPFGERLPLGDLLEDDLFPFEGKVAVKPLEPPTLPEPVRRGAGGDDCHSCGLASGTVWHDAHWQVRIPGDPGGLPIVAILLPLAHHDLADLPDDLAVQLGPMLKRVVAAIDAIGGIGRVHVNRWGDGSEHFHVWLLPRPYGLWQLRGAMLAVWDDLLPKVPRATWNRNRRTVARALAAGGGSPLV
jgi:hypothetical protein